MELHVAPAPFLGQNGRRIRRYKAIVSVMFDFVYRKKRVVQVILALITLPFAFFGVDYYFRGGGAATEIARVGGDTINQVEFANAIRDQQDRMRDSAGKNYDPAMFNN